VSVFEYDADQGKMSLVQTIPALSEDAKSRETFNSASEIRVHPSGRFVYTANRGNDTVTLFSVEDAGRLEWVETTPIRGAWPRNFNLDPSGRWLLAAGRDSNTVAVFEIDPQTGRLTYTRNISSVPTPICVLFQP
jgi:6-phosphogluconolactonase